MVRQSEDKVVFENLKHDFPQRIIYRLKAGGNFAASIGGKVNGKVRTVNFAMRRIDCESQTPNP